MSFSQRAHVCLPNSRSLFVALGCVLVVGCQAKEQTKSQRSSAGAASATEASPRGKAVTASGESFLATGILSIANE